MAKQKHVDDLRQMLNKIKIHTEKIAKFAKVKINVEELNGLLIDSHTKTQDAQDALVVYIEREESNKRDTNPTGKTNPPRKPSVQNIPPGTPSMSAKPQNRDLAVHGRSGASLTEETKRGSPGSNSPQSKHGSKPRTKADILKSTNQTANHKRFEEETQNHPQLKKAPAGQSSNQPQGHRKSTTPVAQSAVQNESRKQQHTRIGRSAPPHPGGQVESNRSPPLSGVYDAQGDDAWADQSKKGSHYQLEETLKQQLCQKDEIIRENVEQFVSEKRQMTDQIRQLTEERDDLNRRFSKLAADNLRRNNADIADLGDQNRAEKIAQQYAHLYDEAWTDAYMAQYRLKQRTEEAIVQNLLQILLDCYKFCEMKCEGQLTMIINMFSHPDQEITDKNKNFSENQYKPTEDQLYELKRLRKEISINKAETLKEAFYKMQLERAKAMDPKEKEHVEKSKGYCYKCVEVCWPMVLHQPPVYLDKEITQGSPVNNDRYTQRSAGKQVVSLVWPPLLLGEDKRMLYKGVVEAK